MVQFTKGNLGALPVNREGFVLIGGGPGSSSKTFQMLFDGPPAFQSALGTAYFSGLGQKITGQELRILGKDVIEPIYKAEAPYQEHGENWVGPLRPHLRDTIQARVLADRELTLRMAATGRLTISGHGEVKPVKGKALRFEAEDGTIIFRRVTAAVKPDPWDQRAYAKVRASRAFESAARTIMDRLLIETGFGQAMQEAGAVTPQQMANARYNVRRLGPRRPGQAHHRPTDAQVQEKIRRERLRAVRQKRKEGLESGSLTRLQRKRLLHQEAGLSTMKQRERLLRQAARVHRQELRHIERMRRADLRAGRSSQNGPLEHFYEREISYRQARIRHIETMASGTEGATRAVRTYRGTVVDHTSRRHIRRGHY